MSHAADSMLKHVGGRSDQGRGKTTPEDREADMKEQTLSPPERGALSAGSRLLGPRCPRQLPRCSFDQERCQEELLFNYVDHLTHGRIGYLRPAPRGSAHARRTRN